MQVGHAFDAFIRDCESVWKLSVYTVRAYRSDLQRFASFAGADNKISASRSSTGISPT